MQDNNIDFNLAMEESDKYALESNKYASTPAAHTHCACGKTGATESGHNEVTSWTAISSLKDITQSGNYYLMQNVKVTSTFAWECNNNVQICLNGYTIVGPKWDATIKVNKGASLTITDCHSGDSVGKITSVENGGSVAISNYGTFILWNGCITENLTRGGVSNNSGATFIMSGGTIAGNNSSVMGTGGGVTNEGTFIVSGNATIQDNTCDYRITPFTDNVYLDGTTITVESGKPLADTARIGILTRDEQNVVTGSTNLTVFTSDDSDFELKDNGSNGLMMKVVSGSVSGVTLLTENGGEAMTNNTKVYDGKAVAYNADSVSYTPSISGVSFRYSWQERTGDTYSNLSDAPSNAGEYRLLVTVRRYGKPFSTEELPFTITKAPGSGTVKASSITYGDPSSYVRGKISSSTNGIDNATRQYKLKDAPDTDYTTTIPTKAGVYTIKVIFPATQNYQEVIATDEFTIAQRPLHVAVKVEDKVYDDTKSAKAVAERDGGFFWDDVTLNTDGVRVEFDTESVGENKSIIFSGEYTLSGEDASNYRLIQPSGITASIRPYIADGNEYSTNSSGWLRSDFIITAKEEWQLSYTNTADGNWVDTLTVSTESNNGTLEFYLRNKVSGIISEKITQPYKIDKTAPTGEIKISENSWKSFLNNITFGRFFKNTQTVTINANDDGSGIKTVEYLLSDKELTKAELDGMAFTAYTAPFGIDPDNEYIIYVRLTDKADNTDYICSDGIVLDGISPVITGIENGKTYCAAQLVTVDEKYIDTVKVNGNTVNLDSNNQFTLNPTEGEQSIVVTDKAGNETRVIVTVNDGHTYEWQSENGQYWQKCKFCNHETAKKDIPTINISGADKVCRTQDYKFSFTLPEGATDAAYGYEFIGLGDGPLTPTVENGLYSGIIKASAYPAEETGFKLIVSAKTADGFEFSAEKTVAIQNEHSGGTATCTEQATCEICGEKYGDLKPHSYSAEWSTDETNHWHECTECRAKTDEAEHTDTNKDHKCDVCDKVLSECTDTNKDHKCDLCGKALSEHSGGKATCKDKAKCEFCGESYGELNANNHSDLKHFPAVAATKTAEGNIEYWYCSGCKKYYKDAKATQEITKAQTVTAKLPSDNNGSNNKPGNNATTSPQTGDNSNFALWIALLFISGGVAIGTTIVSRKKKYNR